MIAPAKGKSTAPPAIVALMFCWPHVFFDHGPETDIIRAMRHAGTIPRAEIQMSLPSQRITASAFIDPGFGLIAPER
jgi:hypothetical protein